MEKVIFENGGGLGIILINENEDDFITQKNVVLHQNLIEVNQMTTLDGRFSTPIRFAVFFKYEKNLMCFHAGDDSDIFEERKYYYCYYRLDENTIANKYREGTARDFKWINGKWK